MKEAVEKQNQVIRQLERQRKKWLTEQGKDQAELQELIEEKELIEAAIYQKYTEIEGENLDQLLRYDQLIREATESRDRLIAKA